MSEIEASNLSKIAICYRRAEGRAERNALFSQIEAHYMPRIANKFADIRFDHRADYLQIYRLEILKALKKWNLKSNFETYLFPYVVGVYPKFVKSIKMFREGITATTFSDIAESAIGAAAIYQQITEEGPKMPNVNVRTETLARFNRARKAENSDDFLNALLDAFDQEKKERAAYTEGAANAAGQGNQDNQGEKHLTEADFDKMKVVDLKKIAKENEIEIKSDFSKEMIVHAIIDSEKYAAGSLVVNLGGENGEN